MTKNIISAVFIFIASGLWAQNCDLYIPLEEGKGYQYQNFNSRDKLEGIQDILIKSVTQESGQTVAVVEAKMYDKREKLQHEGEYKIICKGNELVIDIQSIIDQSILQSFEGMEVSMSNIENISLPGNLGVGDKLPDAHMEMKVSMGGVSVTEMNFTTQNRTVEAKQEITTPAGTYNCFKITYENKMDTRAMGMNRSDLSKGVEYYAPGVGNVRSEFYNDKGKLQSYTVLSKIY